MVDVSSLSFIFEAILLSSILVGIMAWLSIRITRRVGLLDQPNSAPHKHHRAKFCRVVWRYLVAASLVDNDAQIAM
jgi:hypothetical protein